MALAIVLPGRSIAAVLALLLAITVPASGMISGGWPLAAGWGYQCAGLWPPVPALDRGQLEWVNDAAEALAPFTVDP